MKNKLLFIYIFIYDCIEYLKNVLFYFKIYISHIAKCTIKKCTIPYRSNNSDSCNEVYNINNDYNSK